ncbi:MAG: GNAT family N-acetyltransferase [Desulfobacterium sp.]|jgi:hypothetical protein|nr:GNAT family N-acetyltransferase [Desulfobacterium sp.]
MKISAHEDPDECRFIWEKAWPAKGLFDLWEVRSCFHDAFQRPLSFHVVEEGSKILGFLPLCRDEETNKYIQFPGETWHGKTWLEQNRIIARSPGVFDALLDAVPGSVHLRYLVENPLFCLMDQVTSDELGYLFFPRLYDFSFEGYWQSFSGKTRKKLRAEIKKIEAGKVTYRFDRLDDLDRMLVMNINAYGDESYFKDPRFYHAFENLSAFLYKRGLLRITTVLVDGEVAAVDMGAVWKNTYTLLAGGTNPEFPGIAKLINLHHMERSCRERIETVDFLCGDFNWKERFNLTPVPLYQINLERESSTYYGQFHEGQFACA